MMGTAEITNSALWGAADKIPGGPSSSDLKKVFGGYLGIMPADDDWKVSLKD